MSGDEGGRRWSLDARRARLRASRDSAPKRPADSRKTRPSGQLDDARKALATVLHNCGMFVIAAQICMLYSSAGLYKAQGGAWGNGTALHIQPGL